MHGNVKYLFVVHGGEVRLYEFVRLGSCEVVGVRLGVWRLRWLHTRSCHRNASRLLAADVGANNSKKKKASEDDLCSI